jgi:hypothetical protein
MPLLEFVVPLGLIITLSLGFVLDGYAVFLRVAGAQGLGESLAMANLVQYLARISNVLVVFVLSFAFEKGHITSGITLLFMSASILGFVFTVCLMRVKRFCDLVTFCLCPFLNISFPAISKNTVWRDLGESDFKYLRLGLVSALTNALIVVAMFVPFGIAAYYPEMRMTSVYVGQLINFFATLVVFTIQDPISMRLVDGGTFQSAGSALLYGRALSYLLASFVFLLLFLV